MPSCQICEQSLGESIYRSPNAVSVTSLCEVHPKGIEVWFCPRCGHLQTQAMDNLRDYYDKDYRILIASEDEDQLYGMVNGRKVFRTEHQVKTLLDLVPLPNGARILDYGCGNGLFVQYLNERGYTRAAGYDPYVSRFSTLDRDNRFDCVVANDVIEHVDDPRDLVAQCAMLCRPGGLVYIGTADSEPVNMSDLEPHIMRLHQPFHRIILTQAGLTELAQEPGLEVLQSYRRSYMDTLMPFSNYRFLDEFNAALGHDVDRALDPTAGRIVARKPALLLYAFFGYFMPSAYEPAVLLRKPAA